MPHWFNRITAPFCANFYKELITRLTKFAVTPLGTALALLQVTFKKLKPRRDRWYFVLFPKRFLLKFSREIRATPSSRLFSIPAFSTPYPPRVSPANLGSGAGFSHFIRNICSPRPARPQPYHLSLDRLSPSSYSYGSTKILYSSRPPQAELPTLDC